MPEQVSFNINELTQGTVDGTGVFDVLMQAVKAHLKGEFEAGRIRGTDYANAYTMSVGQVLSEASQYATQRAKLEAELKLLDAQTLQVKQEIQTSAAQEDLIAAQTSHTTKQELQTVQETKNLATQELQTKAQTKGIESQTAITDYQLTNVLPKEVEALTQQILLSEEQVKDVTATVGIKEFQLTSMMPVELENLTSTGLNIEAQTANTEQQTENLLTQKTQSEAQHLLEMQAIEVNIGKVTADTVLTTKQCLLVESQSQNQIAQTANIDAQTRQAEYVTSFEIPSRVAANEAQTAMTLAQELQTVQETLNVTAQRDQILAQALDTKAGTKLKDMEYDIQLFNKEFKLPKELEIMTTEIDLKESQIALSNKELIVKQSQVDLADKEIQVKQNQIDLGTKELAIKEAQVGISEKELLIKGEQLLITKYELANKLPADVALTKSQSDLYTQKTVTELAQTDPAAILPDSVIDINNGLIKEQGKSFLRSAEQNTAKLMIDTWNVRHTADPDGNLETAPGLNLKDADVGKAVRKVLEGINVSLG